MVSSEISTLAIISAMSTVALLAPNVIAHQIILLPEPQWKTNDKDTKYNPLAFLENQNFPTSADFGGYLKKNNYNSLRDFLKRANYTVTEGADRDCGFTDPNGTPQPIPAGNNMRFTGYTHDGLCEMWLDDTKVLSGSNCHNDFPGKDCPVDYSSCKDNCVMYWYWLAVRLLKNEYSWQVYKACIPLTRSGKTGTPDKKKLRV